MKIKKLLINKNFELLSENVDLNKEISGIECCDLLSWVMANGKENEAWITVQIHSNIIAVATLLDFSCIIIPEDIKVDEEVILKSNEENIPLISTDLSAYEIFKIMYENGI